MEGLRATSKPSEPDENDSSRLARDMRSPDSTLDQVTAAAETAVRRPPMKIFQIGFNKCGTSTIHRYLCANGVRSVHWDKGRLAQRMFRNLANGEALLTGYEDFDAFTDMEFLDSAGVYLEAYKLFPYLAAQYPDAVFILNTRDREAWIKSRFGHGSNMPYAMRQMTYYNVTSNEELAGLWRADWERHHHRITEFFSGQPHRFFVCRIETDLPHLLNEKLPECMLDAAHYSLWKTGKSRSRHTDLHQYAKAMKRHARSLLGRVLPVNLR
jgi:hypothetical protein